ncbi:MAG: hypothetical protein ACI9E5_001187 [Candidatus Omnitrophota bacterium]|jgi:hypothetical protein
MKSIKSAFIALFLITVLATNSYAGFNPFKKIVRGVVDIVTSPINIARTTSEQVELNSGNSVFHGPFIGFLAGLMEGSAEMVNQAFIGVVKIATFPVE